MLKVMTLVGTRPELIKMSRVIAELDRQVNHVLVHSGQNYDYELNQVFFDDLEIRKPDHFLGACHLYTSDSADDSLCILSVVRLFLCKHNLDCNHRGRQYL